MKLHDRPIYFLILLATRKIRISGKCLTFVIFKRHETAPAKNSIVIFTKFSYVNISFICPTYNLYDLQTFYIAMMNCDIFCNFNFIEKENYEFGNLVSSIFRKL